MQLFVTEYKKQWTTVIVSNPEILLQVRKVLRAKIGDKIYIQSPSNEEVKTRYEIEIEQRNDKDIQWKIISEHIHESTPETKSMIISMPNKRDKIELIVQKLTECGLDQIIFWPSERSVIKERNPKKEERLQKIIKEAVEQSRGRNIPELHFATDIKKYLQDTEVIVFDKTGTKTQETKPSPKSQVPNPKSQITGIIWPEGGLTPKDYQTFEWTEYTIYGLGETVLRTETAAIVWGRLLKNN